MNLVEGFLENIRLLLSEKGQMEVAGQSLLSTAGIHSTSGTNRKKLTVDDLPNS